MVTSDVVLRHIVRAGLPCAPLAAPTRMPDGVNAPGVRLDWARLDPAGALGAWYASAGHPAAAAPRRRAGPQRAARLLPAALRRAG
jgi:hypothetical protein